MTTITRTPVVFNVPSETDGIPAGTYDGFLEHITIKLRGFERTQLNRAAVHLTRDEHPECFSDKNSSTAIDADVTKHVLNGSITYR